MSTKINWTSLIFFSQLSLGNLIFSRKQGIKHPKSCSLKRVLRKESKSIFITGKVPSLLSVYKPSYHFLQKNCTVWPQSKQLIGELMERGSQKKNLCPSCSQWQLVTRNQSSTNASHQGEDVLRIDRQENRGHLLPSIATGCSATEGKLFMSINLTRIFLTACLTGADCLCAVPQKRLSLFCPPVSHLHGRGGLDRCSPWPAM